MRVMVTGGAGYIGSVVAAQLLAAGDEVIVVDDLSTGHADAVPPGAEFHQVGIADVGAVLSGRGVEAVVHFAAKSLVGESVRDPAGYWHNNVGGTLALLDAMQANDVARMVFSSSAAAYGNVEETPIRETACTRPTSAYGASKLAIDLALGNYATAYGLAAVSLRYFNVAGAHSCPDGSMIGERHDPETHLIPIALQVAAGKREKLQLFGDDYPTVDGTCVRDYIHVEDLARAHLLALEAATPGEHKIYNLGNGNGFTNRQVAEAAREVTGADLPVEVAPRREGDPATLVASSQRARDELGWVPEKHTLADMIGDAWTFYRSHVG
jgi:UDP-glucose 4-epimerase